jgi:flagellar hook protein FlgE
MYTGAAGLLSFQQGINVESNNVANVNTVGFKSDTVSFNDLMYQKGVGKGTTTNDVFKNFTQGSLKPSNSSYDFAIAGEGFFTLQDPETPDKLFYTRTGQFSTNNENFLTNSTGLIVMGMRPDVTGDIITSEYEKSITSTLVNEETSTYTLNTYTTDYFTNSKEIQSVMDNIDAIDAVNNATATQEQQDIIDNNPSLMTNYTKYNTEVLALQNATTGNNKKSINSILNDIDKVITSYSNALKSFALNPAEGTASTKQETSVTFPLIIDADGLYTLELFVNGVKVQQGFDTSMANSLNLFSDKINELPGITSNVDTATGELIISSLVSGEKMTISKPKLNDDTLAITEIEVATGSGQSLVDALYVDLEEALAKLGATAASNKSEITDIATATTPAFDTIVLDLNELGLSSVLSERIANGDPTAIASYPDIESEDGNLYLTDGDARFLVGRLLPVAFTNVSGLSPEGDNIYTQSTDQKDPIYLEGAATVEGRFLENSNINLSETLVNLMVWQKAFDANSKTVSTSDELLKTALALKNN